MQTCKNSDQKPYYFTSMPMTPILEKAPLGVANMKLTKYIGLYHKQKEAHMATQSQKPYCQK